MKKNKKPDILRIAKPERTEEGYEFYPIVRVGRIIPFGYYESEEDSNVLIPIPEELLLLEDAKEHLKSYSLRDVSKWLTAKSGRYISHVGLDRRVKSEQTKAKDFLNSRQLAKKFRDAYHTARMIEESRLGHRAPTKEELDDELRQSITTIFDD